MMDDLGGLLENILNKISDSFKPIEDPVSITGHKIKNKKYYFYFHFFFFENLNFNFNWIISA
jgi:hypothetical protein